MQSPTLIKTSIIIVMKQTHQIAYNYAMAHIKQNVAEDQVNSALRSLGSDNQIFSLCEPISSAYTNLVQQLLSPELFDWLLWWMYETDMGKRPMMFVIDNITYDPTSMTLYNFLSTIDESK